MSVQTRHEYAREVSFRYCGASRKEKTGLLDEFARTCGYNRKYALAVLRNPPPCRKAPIKRPRARRYDEAVRRVLAQVWEVSSGLCAKRLVPFLPDLLQALERHGELRLEGDLKEKLLSISAASADRLLVSVRCQGALHGKSTTKPGTLLRQQIQVRTSFGWEECRPGYFEADLVAHCAESAAGDFLHTLTLTDIATGWTECDGLLNRGERAVVEAVDRIRHRLPFAVLGIDSDNGSEFINHLLKRYCDRDTIQFTRCRPYHKNDQCHVEQKNWSVVRRFIGYARYEGAEECKRLQSVHRWLRLYVNFFQPSMQLESKLCGQDGKVRKTYRPAQTPYQRLLASGILTDQAARDLQELYDGLNPCEVLRHLKDAIDRLHQAEKARISHEATKHL